MWQVHTTTKHFTDPVSSNPHNKGFSSSFCWWRIWGSERSSDFHRPHSSWATEQHLNLSKLTPKTMRFPLHYPVWKSLLFLSSVFSLELLMGELTPSTLLSCICTAYLCISANAEIWPTGSHYDGTQLPPGRSATPGKDPWSPCCTHADGKLQIRLGLQVAKGNAMSHGR